MAVDKEIHLIRTAESEFNPIWIRLRNGVQTEAKPQKPFVFWKVDGGNRIAEAAKDLTKSQWLGV